MAILRRAIALNTLAAAARLQPQTISSRCRSLPTSISGFRAYPAPPLRRQYSVTQTRSANQQTLTEKIVQKYAVGLAPGKKVKSGDYIMIAPHKVMTHDNTWPVAKKFMEIGASRIHDKDQLVFTTDHDVTNKSEANLKKYAQIQEFADKHGVTRFGAGYGIGHQIMVQEGFAWPSTLTVASDSHSNHVGGNGALGTPIVRTDAAAIFATGQTWWQVPPIAKITFTGILPPGVSGKDVIVALCGLFNQDEVLNHAIEFAGSEQTMESIPIDFRSTIANMTTEWGALSGLFPIDEKLISWYRAKASAAELLGSPCKVRINHDRVDELVKNRLTADAGATYAKELYLNLSTLAPFVAGPNSVKIVTPLDKLEPQNLAIDRAYLVSCTNSRASDIAAAARVFREAAEAGKPAKIAPGVKFYIAAASQAEQQAAEEANDWQVLLDAGAQSMPSGCAQCIGLGPGLLQEGERGVSASNRNFKGRLGHPKSEAYLASPEIVAASALQGKIAGPGWYQKPEGVEKVIIGEGSGDPGADRARDIENAFDELLAEFESMIDKAEKAASGEKSSVPASDVPTESAAPAGDGNVTDILPGFPEKIEGEIVFCDADNINTDGIYPGKYTYQDDVSREKMAEVCMENYDPEFGRFTKPGDILVAGQNFGCGSSREQAATAILARQIPLVVGGSFNNIFGRNSINNALITLEVPKLVQRLRETYKDDPEKPLTRRTGWKLLWDVRRSKVVITEQDGSSWEQTVGSMPPNIQEVIACGGLEKWVKSKINT